MTNSWARRWLAASYLACAIPTVTAHAQPTPPAPEPAPPAPAPATPAATATPSPPAPIPPVALKRNSSTLSLAQESTSSIDTRARQTMPELDRVSRLYETAQRLFGYEHVLLTAIAYSGRRCTDSSRDTFWSCGGGEQAKATRSGLGALIGVPLVGGGAGHGWTDWWPRFETRQAVEVYLDYQHAAFQWSKLLTKYGTTSDASAEERRRGLLYAAQALDKLLDRAIAPYQDPDDPVSDAESAKANDDDEWPLALRVCVRKLVAKLGQLEGAAAKKDEGSSLPAEIRALDANGKSPAIETISSGMCSQQRAGDKETYTVEAAAEELDGLWNVYRQLAHVRAPTGRHNWLFGPAVVIPFQDVAREWFYGLVLEAGRPWLRATFSGGFRTTYDNPFVVAPTGWFAGIGVSGEFADDLFHLANGARNAGNELRSALGRAKDQP